jgi:cytidylate kinase
MLVDSTSMTTEQVVQRILDLVRGAQQASRA